MDSSIFVAHSHVVLRLYQALPAQANQDNKLRYALVIAFRRSTIYVNQANA